MLHSAEVICYNLQIISKAGHDCSSKKKRMWLKSRSKFEIKFGHTKNILRVHTYPLKSWRGCWRWIWRRRMRRWHPCFWSPPSVFGQFVSVFTFIRQQRVCPCVIHSVTAAPVSRVHGGNGGAGRNRCKHRKLKCRKQLKIPETAWNTGNRKS